MPVFLEVRRPQAVSLEEWYAVDSVRATKNTLAFVYTPSKSGPVTAADLIILQTARAYLADSANWTKVDEGDIPNVRCPIIALRRSIICALHDGALFADGEFYWGRKAMVDLREEIARSSSRQYQHWFTGFNRDSSTTHASVIGVFDRTINRLRQQRNSR